MKPETAYQLQELYRLVERDLLLSRSDFEFDGTSQTRWERNVRILQARVARGEIIRVEDAGYMRPASPESGGPTLSWADRGASTLHRRLLAALGTHVIEPPGPGSLKLKPLLLALEPPLPPSAAFFVYLTTDHPSERSAGDYRIQVILPGHARSRRAHLTCPPA